MSDSQHSVEHACAQARQQSTAPELQSTTPAQLCDVGLNSGNKCSYGIEITERGFPVRNCWDILVVGRSALVPRPHPSVVCLGVHAKSIASTAIGVWFAKAFSFVCAAGGRKLGILYLFLLLVCILTTCDQEHRHLEAFANLHPQKSKGTASKQASIPEVQCDNLDASPSIASIASIVF